MSLATFQDLCLDVNDERAGAEFWIHVLGLDLFKYDDGDLKLVGPTDQHTIWPNVVPEPHTVKNRVHVDVWAASLEPFEGLRRVSELGQFPWTTFLDPEGNEFCVFVADVPPDYRLKAVEVDAADPPAIADWWHGVLGGTREAEGDECHSVSDIPGVPFEGFDFVVVPEFKTVKNRVHWDIRLVAGRSVGDLEAAGATVLRRPDDDIRWTIMADPEGNEFCAFDPR